MLNESGLCEFATSRLRLDVYTRPPSLENMKISRCKQINTRGHEKAREQRSSSVSIHGARKDNRRTTGLYSHGRYYRTLFPGPCRLQDKDLIDTMSTASLLPESIVLPIRRLIGRFKSSFEYHQHRSKAVWLFGVRLQRNFNITAISHGQ